MTVIIVLRIIGGSRVFGISQIPSIGVDKSYVCAFVVGGIVHIIPAHMLILVIITTYMRIIPVVQNAAVHAWILLWVWYADASRKLHRHPHPVGMHMHHATIMKGANIRIVVVSFIVVNRIVFGYV